MKAKDWDQAYRDGDTPWNKGKTAPPLMEWVNQNDIDGEVLVLGCGEGHDVRFLANHCKSVTGMDISETAIGLAKNHSILNNVQYICQDFFDESISSAVRYDWIFEHTFFCAIEPCLRNAYRDQVGKLLKPSAASLTKGCYLGQEVVSRLYHLGTPQRGLYVVSLLSDVKTLDIQLPEILFFEGRKIGELRTLYYVEGKASSWMGVALLKERFIGSFEKGVELNGSKIQLVKKLKMCDE